MSRNGQINQVRLKTVGMPETPYRGFAQPGSGSHCTRAPVRGIEGLLLRCFANHFSRASFVNGARSTGSRRILLKCLDATVQVAIAPARSLLWLISETYPSGRTVAALVDGAGRTSQVYNLADSKLYTEYAGYRPSGALWYTNFGNNVSETWSVNSRMQPTGVSASNSPGTLLLSQTLDYGMSNNNENVRSQTIVWPGVSSLQ